MGWVMLSRIMESVKTCSSPPDASMMPRSMRAKITFTGTMMHMGNQKMRARNRSSALRSVAGATGSTCAAVSAGVT